MQSTLKSVALRVLLYFGLAFGFLIVCGLLLLLSVRTGIIMPARWFALALYTTVLLWAAVGTSREHWHSPAYWSAVAGLLALHLLGFVAVLRHYPQWPSVWYIPVIIVEAGLFGSILGALFKRRIKSRHR
jgi:hypothetical protein